MCAQPMIRIPVRKDFATGKKPEQPLSGLRLLIVEDEYLVAEELAEKLARAGAEVLAPVSDIGLALCSLAENDPGVAVLDIDLRGRAVFPLADELTVRKLPFIFYTGYDDILIPSRFGGVRCVRKPASGSELVQALLDSRNSPGLRTASDTAPDESVVAVLPRLRSMALALTGERMAADRVVEAALRRAIAGVDRRPADIPVGEWLARLVRNSANDSNSTCLH